MSARVAVRSIGRSLMMLSAAWFCVGLVAVLAVSR